MLDKCLAQQGCATKPSTYAEWFRYFEVVMGHPDLCLDEQYLWLWLATHCVNRSHHSCTFSYQQISRAVKMSLKAVHCALFRLKLTGFLNGDLPIWYGEPTVEMGKQERVLRPLPLSEEAFRRQQVIEKNENIIHPFLKRMTKNRCC